MTEMDIESTACGRNEIGPQDRYFLPDPGFTPGHDRDAYRVTQVRAPIFLSRNEDFQLFSTFFRFFHPFPKTEVERGGKRWNANAKRVETGETDSTLFHLFPPVSTCFHLKIISGNNEGAKTRRIHPTPDTWHMTLSAVRLIPPYSGLSRLIGDDAARASALFRGKPG